MADIRVTCPTCKTQLEIDAVHEGEEVECGNCLQVFVATAKKPGDSGGGRVRGATSRSRASRDDDDDDRPRRRRRDDDDDDDDYYDRPRRRSGGGSGMAITALVLGIISLPACCCPIVGIMTSLGAIVTGSLGMKSQEGKGMAVAGLVMGIIGLILAVVNAAAGVAMNLNNPGRFR